MRSIFALLEQDFVNPFRFPIIWLTAINLPQTPHDLGQFLFIQIGFLLHSYLCAHSSQATGMSSLQSAMEKH